MKGDICKEIPTPIGPDNCPKCPKIVCERAPVICPPLYCDTCKSKCKEGETCIPSKQPKEKNGCEKCDIILCKKSYVPKYKCPPVKCDGCPKDCKGKCTKTAADPPKDAKGCKNCDKYTCKDTEPNYKCPPVKCDGCPKDCKVKCTKTAADPPKDAKGCKNCDKYTCKENEPDCKALKDCDKNPCKKHDCKNGQKCIISPVTGKDGCQQCPKAECADEAGGYGNTCKNPIKCRVPNCGRGCKKCSDQQTCKITERKNKRNCAVCPKINCIDG